MDTTQMSPIRGVQNSLIPSADLESSPGSTDSSVNSSTHHAYPFQGFPNAQGPYYTNSSGATSVLKLYKKNYFPVNPLLNVKTNLINKLTKLNSSSAAGSSSSGKVLRPAARRHLCHRKGLRGAIPALLRHTGLWPRERS